MHQRGKVISIFLGIGTFVWATVGVCDVVLGLPDWGRQLTNWIKILAGPSSWLQITVLLLVSITFFLYAFWPQLRMRFRKVRIVGSTFDMMGGEVIDYSLANSNIETISEITDALSVAALKKQIHVEAMPLDDHRFLPVDNTVFAKYTFWLISKKRQDELKELYEIQYGRLYPTGGCIWRVTDHEVLYECPVFERAEIEALWPKR